MGQLVLALDTLGRNGKVSVGFGHFMSKWDIQCWLWTLQVEMGQLVLALDTLGRNGTFGAGFGHFR